MAVKGLRVMVVLGVAAWTSSVAAGQNEDFVSMGCFLIHDGARVRLDESQAGDAAVCQSECHTRFFAVTGTLCQCFVDVPDCTRQALGSCSEVGGVPQDQLMQLFFNQGEPAASNCNSEAVRTFLVEESNAPGGFDIVSNAFKTSPFDLYSVDCGTNMYDISTDVTGNTNTLETTVTAASNYARSRKDDRQRSITGSVSVSGSGLGVEASLAVSASFDKSQTDIFNSMGAQASNSKVLESLGVQRVATVEIKDFDAKRHFVTFTDAFVQNLRTYRDSGYAATEANKIVDKYGQFAVTYGSYGGYVRSRATVSGDKLDSLFSTERASKDCYEASVAASGAAYGFEVAGSLESSGCDESATSDLQEATRSFEESAVSETLVGGTDVPIPGRSEDAFTVTPETSKLLTDTSMYPSGERALELRLISDFLAADKVSPLMVARSHIEEFEFAEIGQHLEAHILGALNAIADKLESDECGCDSEDGEDIPFLTQYDPMHADQAQCSCFRPVGVDSTTITVQIPGHGKTLTLCEVEAYDLLGNKLEIIDATQSGTKAHFGPELALDGRRGPTFFADPSTRESQCAQTLTSSDPFWRATIRAPRGQIGRIEIFNTTSVDYCEGCPKSLQTVEVLLGEDKVYTASDAQRRHMIPFGRPSELTIKLRGADKILTLCEVEVYDKQGNKVPLFNPTQSSTHYTFGADLALDGHYGSRFYALDYGLFGASRANGLGGRGPARCTHTAVGRSDPWWRASLPMRPEGVGYIEVFNRLCDGACRDRLVGAEVLLDGEVVMTVSNVKGSYRSGAIPATTEIKVDLPGSNKILTLCEVEVFDKDGNKVPLLDPSQSSNHGAVGTADRAVDGARGPSFWYDSARRDAQCTHTMVSGSNPYWRATIPLARDSIGHIRVTNRQDCCSDRLIGARIRLGGSVEYTVTAAEQFYAIDVGTRTLRQRLLAMAHSRR